MPLSIALFTLPSLLCGLSQSMGQFVTFRALQGTGGGALISMSWVANGDSFSPRERGRYQGLSGAVFGFSSAIGPIVRGLLTDGLGWRLRLERPAGGDGRRFVAQSDRWEMP